MFDFAELFLFCFAVIGMTLILVKGSIFESFREFFAHKVELLAQEREEKGAPHKFTIVEFFNKMIQCVQCAGFWCGIFCGLFLLACDIYHSAFTAKLYSVAIDFSNNRVNLSQWYWQTARIIRWVMLVFCCGAAGSFLSMFGDFVLQWLYASNELKGLTAKQLLQEKNEEIEIKD
jgi:hypothetical protein